MGWGWGEEGEGREKGGQVGGRREKGGGMGEGGSLIKRSLQMQKNNIPDAAALEGCGFMRGSCLGQHKMCCILQSPYPPITLTKLFA